MIKSLAYSNEQETIDFFIKYGKDIEEKYKLKLAEFDFNCKNYVLKNGKYFIKINNKLKPLDYDDISSLATLKSFLLTSFAEDIVRDF
ncbi:MAG: hypothetical protein K2F59_05800 [Eubacteriales bacterium]|nr:hypothetical protein [Eubacteriales bacterium]